MFSVKVVYSALLKEQKEKGTAREWAEANKKSDSERAQAVQHKLFTMVKRECTWLVDVAAAEEFAEDLRQLMQQCWEQDPLQRPTAKQVGAKLKSGGRRVFNSGRLSRFMAVAGKWQNRECLLGEDATESYFTEFKKATLEMMVAQGGIVGWTAKADDVIAQMKKE